MSDNIQSDLRQPVSRKPSDRPEAPRVRPADLGGAKLKLAVDFNIPGYKAMWINDLHGSVEQHYADGFDFVTPAEVAGSSRGRSLPNVAPGLDTADRISKHVDTTEGGQSIRAYLMKCTEETWEDRQAATAEQSNKWDSAIRRSLEEDSRYVPNGYTNSLKTRNRQE
jgi:hypothetical protein